MFTKNKNSSVLSRGPCCLVEGKKEKGYLTTKRNNAGTFRKVKGEPYRNMELYYSLYATKFAGPGFLPNFLPIGVTVSGIIGVKGRQIERQTDR